MEYIIIDESGWDISKDTHFKTLKEAKEHLRICESCSKEKGLKIKKVM